jgi:hypothetical protein
MRARLPMDSYAIVRTATRVLPAAYALFLGLNAQAANLTDPAPRGLAAAFGNTVKALYADGRYERIWLHEDGSWEALGRSGKSSSGKWRQKGEKVCLHQSRPFPVPFSYCTEFPPDGGLGVAWSGRDMKGEPIRLTVVRGIERPTAPGS